MAMVFFYIHKQTDPPKHAPTHSPPKPASHQSNTTPPSPSSPPPPPPPSPTSSPSPSPSPSPPNQNPTSAPYSSKPPTQSPCSPARDSRPQDGSRCMLPRCRRRARVGLAILLASGRGGCPSGLGSILRLRGGRWRGCPGLSGRLGGWGGRRGGWRMRLFFWWGF